MTNKRKLDKQLTNKTISAKQSIDKSNRHCLNILTNRDSLISDCVFYNPINISCTCILKLGCISYFWFG